MTAIAALSGTPGTGKTAIASALSGMGWRVIELGDLARSSGAVVGRDEERDTDEVDMELLEGALEDALAGPDPRRTLLVGHYAHLLPCDAVVVLRTSPAVLRQRLEDRGWPPSKVQENVEAEADGAGRGGPGLRGRHQPDPAGGERSHGGRDPGGRRRGPGGRMGGLVRGGDGLVLNEYRSRVDPLMKPIAERLQNVDPDTLSWLAMAFAILAGALFIVGWELDNHHLLLLAFVSIVLNAVLDALDGYVARFTGKASRLGDFLDHVLDRYADAFIFGGVAVSGYCHTPVGVLAIFGVFFTSYMGTQGQAIGLTRNYGGIMGRADRLALLLLFVLAQWAYIVVYEDPVLVTLDVWGVAYPLTLMEVLMVIVAVGGNVTALQRGVAAWKDIKRMEAEGLLEAPETPQGLVTVESVDDGEEDGSSDEDAPHGGERDPE